MSRQTKWLARTLISTGIIVVALLTIAINRGPLLEGFRPYRPAQNTPPLLCPWCNDETPPSLGDYLGAALIMFLILLIPSGHIAVIILVAQQLNRASTPQTSSKLPRCPYCERPLHHGWKACPTCGNRLEMPPPTTPSASSSAHAN